MSKVLNPIPFWLRKMQIANPFLYLGSQMFFRFLLEPGIWPFSKVPFFLVFFGLLRIGVRGTCPGLIKAVAPSSTGMGDMPIIRAPSRIGSVTGESSSVPQVVIEVDEVPQEEIWSALEERGDVVQNIVRNRSQESSLRQRLNAFGNEPLLLGKNKTDYWEDVQSNLRSAETQKEYNNLLDFENRDLEIREFKINVCLF